MGFISSLSQASGTEMNTLTDIKGINSSKRKASFKIPGTFCFSEWHAQLQLNLQWINATCRVPSQRSMQALPKQLTPILVSLQYVSAYTLAQLNYPSKEQSVSLQRKYIF